MSSIMTFALLKSAKDADEAWEKAIKNKQNNAIIESRTTTIDDTNNTI